MRDEYSGSPPDDHEIRKDHQRAEGFDGGAEAYRQQAELLGRAWKTIPSKPGWEREVWAKIRAGASRPPPGHGPSEDPVAIGTTSPSRSEPGKVIPFPRRRLARWFGAGGALAAACVLVIINPGILNSISGLFGSPQAPSVGSPQAPPVPPCRLEISTTMSGAPAPSHDPAPIRLRPEGSFKLIVRPDTAVEGEVVARAALFQGDRIEPWSPPLRIENGVVVIKGVVKQLFSVPPGVWTLAIAVGRPQAMPEDLSLLAPDRGDSSAATFRLLHREIELLPR